MIICRYFFVFVLYLSLNPFCALKANQIDHQEEVIPQDEFQNFLENNDDEEIDFDRLDNFFVDHNVLDYITPPQPSWFARLCAPWAAAIFMFYLDCKKRYEQFAARYNLKLLSISDNPGRLDEQEFPTEPRS